MTTSASAVLLDVDGTLVDSNYQHALGWYRALREHDITLPVWRIHRQIGKGGDRLIEDLCGRAVEREHGDDIRAAEADRFAELIGEVRPLPHARDLLVALHEQGTTTVLASSCKQDDLDRYLDLLDARDLVDAWTTSDEVETTKPAPDLLEVALERAGTRRAVMLGDATWDCRAAGHAGIASVGLLTGGFSREELLDAGAREVFDALDMLVDGLPTSLAPV